MRYAHLPSQVCSPAVRVLRPCARLTGAGLSRCRACGPPGRAPVARDLHRIDRRGQGRRHDEGDQALPASRRPSRRRDRGAEDTRGARHLRQAPARQPPAHPRRRRLGCRGPSVPARLARLSLGNHRRRARRAYRARSPSLPALGRPQAGRCRRRQHLRCASRRSADVPDRSRLAARCAGRRHVRSSRKPLSRRHRPRRATKRPCRGWRGRPSRLRRLRSRRLGQPRDRRPRERGQDDVRAPGDHCRPPAGARDSGLASRHGRGDRPREWPASPLRGPPPRRGRRSAQRVAVRAEHLVSHRPRQRVPWLQVAEKRYLMTPGPTPAPPEVLAAIAQPVIHHRGPDYKRLYAECLGRLREVFRTEQEVLLFGGSGTGAMESAVANLCSPGEPVLVVSAGYFGERWAAIAKAYGAEVDHLRYAWSAIPSAEETTVRLREREATALFFTHSETSTGVVSDPQAFAAAAREAGALSAVDAISSLGAVPLETDAWGIDVVASGGQKALMTPPGLALVSASPAAWKKTASGASPRFYWDWEITRKGQATLDAPVTPPVSLVAGLNVALGMLLEEGLEAAFERHIRLGRACREGLKAMGLELFSPDDDSSAVVTAARAPEGIDSDELVLLLRDRHGVTLAPGQGELKGKIFRIGHIGYYDVFDITTALAAVELALVELGAEIERGVAVTRALEAFEHTPV